LRLAPVALFAASAGALIGLDLVLRHPQLVRGAVLQEPSLFSVLPDPDTPLAPRRALVQNALRSGGPRAVVEALLRYLNDDDVLRVIPADILERMLANADTIVNFEGAFAQWRPPAEALATVTVPITLMVARETKPEYVAVVRWLERRLDARTITMPGRHGFYYYRPQDLADAVRPVFKEMVAASA
jgi:pimeloyl-ACP methyl ester carboxylesterase